ARDVREPDLAVASEDAGGDTVELGVETVGEDARAVGDTVAVRVFDQAHDLTFDRKLLGLLAEDLLVHSAAILDRARGKVQLEDAHVVADVEHAAAIAMRLRDEESALLVEIDGDR